MLKAIQYLKELSCKNLCINQEMLGVREDGRGSGVKSEWYRM